MAPSSAPMENQITFITVMVTYITLLILWGVYQGRKVKSGSDFAIAGRKLPGWVAALSERATGESSWALLGLPGAAYATGLTEIWTAAGCVDSLLHRVPCSSRIETGRCRGRASWTAAASRQVLQLNHGLSRDVGNVGLGWYCRYLESQAVYRNKGRQRWLQCHTHRRG